MVNFRLFFAVLCFCAMVGCKLCKKQQGNGVSFHRVKASWLNVLPECKVSVDRICSDHFDSDSYYQYFDHSGVEIRRLKETAIPRIFAETTAALSVSAYIDSQIGSSLLAYGKAYELHTVDGALQSCCYVFN